MSTNMRVTHALLVSTVLAFCTLLTSEQTWARPIYSAAGDFSIASNPNGVWTYGYLDPGNTDTTSNLTVFNTQHAHWAATTANVQNWDLNSATFGAVAKNFEAVQETIATTIQMAPGQLVLHPGNAANLDADVRFTATSPILVNVSALFAAADTTGTSTDVHVFVNGLSVFDSTITGIVGHSGTSASYTNPSTISLATNGVIDFLVGFGSNQSYSNDGTSLAATVTVVPEPSSALLLISAGVGLVFWARRGMQMTSSKKASSFFAWLLVALVIGIAAGPADASNIISLNFDSGNDQGGLPAPTYPLAPGTSAGVVHVPNWNNLSTNSGSSSSLMDSAGNTVTGASVVYNSNGTYETNTNAATNGDFTMMHAGIDERGPNPATVTVTLPTGAYASYNVYAYFDAVTNNGAVVAGYTIGSQSYYTSDTASFAGTYVQATGTTSGTATAGSNYAEFTNVGGSFILTATPANGFRAELMGLQIQGVPEPSSALLLTVAGAGLVFWGRRRRDQR